MRPKAIGLAQHGGSLGWLEESNQEGVILHVMDGPYCPPFLYRTGCPGRKLPSWELMEFPAAACYIVNVHKNYVTRRRHGLVL